MVTSTDTSVADGSANGILARIYDSGGTILVPAFQANAITASKQNGSDIAILADGRIVITYTDGSGSGGFGKFRRYSAVPYFAVHAGSGLVISGFPDSIWWINLCQIDHLSENAPEISTDTSMRPDGGTVTPASRYCHAASRRFSLRLSQ